MGRECSDLRFPPCREVRDEGGTPLVVFLLGILSPLRGLIFLAANPGLTPRALFWRRFAALCFWAWAGFCCVGICCHG
jgi:hypothetical protein